MSIAQEFPQAGLVENMTTGELTINSATQRITIQHNLGKRPDVIALWGDFADGASIPYGSCIRCLYFRNPFTQALWTGNNMQYLYDYRHATSGNILTASSCEASTSFTDTTAACPRGVSDWQPTDANGNPITYKWCAIKFKEFF